MCHPASAAKHFYCLPLIDITLVSQNITFEALHRVTVHVAYFRTAVHKWLGRAL